MNLNLCITNVNNKFLQDILYTFVIFDSELLDTFVITPQILLIE